MRELPADLLTPVAAYLRVRHRGPGFLLESVERGQQVGRYSFMAAGCEPIELDAASGFEPLRSALARHGDADLDGLPPFCGGVVGCLAYDAACDLRAERAAAAARDGDDEALGRFLFAPVVVAFDHVRQTLQVVAQPGYGRAADELCADLLGPLPAGVEPVPALSGAGQSYPERTPADYEAMVRAAQVHIERGDVFQMVPSQLIARPTAASAFSLYRALRAVNPSPYMVFCDLGDRQIVSASPETHVSLSRAGSRRSSRSPARAGATPTAPPTTRSRASSRRDEKERAEHLMLVDLARNDLGRVCEPGSVRVSKLLEVERYSHVMHLVSQVDGRLRDGEDALSLLQATFPAGTVSGAPKVRAMQLISAIEGTRRGVYAGALGYVGFDGALDTCIALRTIVMRDGVALLQAGAGIVADSDPASEHVECMNKLAALSAAIDLAETGRYGR